MYLRKGNLQFQVTQNNLDESLVVESFKKIVDERREGDYYGYEEKDVISKDFLKLLPLEIQEIVEDNIEYTQEGHDLKEVLDRFINFKVVSNKNQSVEMNVYTERQISDLKKFSFLITLEPKIHLREKIKSILGTISNVQNVVHQQTGLINAQSFPDVLDEVMDFLHEAKIEGVLCVVTLEGFPNFRRDNGKEKADEVLAKIGYTIRSTFRSRDIVSYLGVGKFAIVLVKTFEDETVYPLKRLREGLKKAGILSNKLSYNIRYKSIDLEVEAKNEIENAISKKINLTISL